MKTHDIPAWLSSSAFENKALTLYGEHFAKPQAKRYLNLLERFVHDFPQHDEVQLFSSSGRIEVSGNHTDHQLGQVIAAAIHLDTLAFVAPNAENVIRVHAQGFDIADVHLDDLQVRKDEYYSSMALIRGLAHDFKTRFGQVGGFDAVLTSDVMPGSGLSSSASFEVLIIAILNDLYGENQMTRSELAQASQRSENVYFNKPCGLMDQMAIAQGNFCFIDFHDAKNPVVEPLVAGNLLKSHDICLVQTGGSHADLSSAYALITQDLKQVSAHFGQAVLSRVKASDFYAQLPQLNAALPSRALLRAHHYYSEIDRVQKLKTIIDAQDIQAFLDSIIDSGRSSYMYLQNIMHPSSEAQPLALALAIAEQELKGQGAWRVHGGGFGGTILMFVPHAHMQKVQTRFTALFGPDSFIPVHLRPIGVTKLI